MAPAGAGAVLRLLLDVALAAVPPTAWQRDCARHLEAVRPRLEALDRRFADVVVRTGQTRYVTAGTRDEFLVAAVEIVPRDEAVVAWWTVQVEASDFGWGDRDWEDHSSPSMQLHLIRPRHGRMAKLSLNPAVGRWPRSVVRRFRALVRPALDACLDAEP